MVTHQLQVERRTGKVRRPETDVLPLCHATNTHTTRVIKQQQQWDLEGSQVAVAGQEVLDAAELARVGVRGIDGADDAAGGQHGHVRQREHVASTAERRRVTVDRPDSDHQRRRGRQVAAGVSDLNRRCKNVVEKKR